jgi:hypothetical protein
MSYTPIFTYNGGQNPVPDYIRMLISDTQQYLPDGVTPGFVFSDQEISSAVQVVSAPFQSAQFYSPPQGQYLPQGVIMPWYRIAATLLDCMAANKAKLASIKRILDVQLDSSDAAKFLQAQAKSYRDQDDNCGSFMIIEQVNNEWSLYQRYWAQVQRSQGVGY